MHEKCLERYVKQKKICRDKRWFVRPTKQRQKILQKHANSILPDEGNLEKNIFS